MSGMLKLTALADLARAQVASAGLPLQMALTDILPDPENTRRPFAERSPDEQQKQRELNADIKERGVKSPISLRPHPDAQGKWMINFGHCRYEGAMAAGLTTIPYFVDLNFNSFDQINENELRSNLSPFALAAFIDGKLKEGMTKGEIAAGLRKANQNFVTEHLALVNPPQCLLDAYKAGVKSARTLYELRRAWDEFPTQIEAWCVTEPRITRETLRERLTAFRGSENPAEVDGLSKRRCVADAHNTTEEFRHDEIASVSAEQVDGRAVSGGAGFRHDEKRVGRIDTEHGSKNVCDGTALRKPTSSDDKIVVRYKGEAAVIAPNATVKIVVVGRDNLLEVPFAELVFSKI